MPEETTVGVADFRVGRFGEAVFFAMALDAEDVLNFVLDVMGLAGGFYEVVFELLEFVASAVDCGFVR
jgi:hypothetical protein